MDFEDLNERLLFAIPKKGRLHETCLQLLKGADIQFHRRNRLDIAFSTNHPIALVFLPAHDIANFVGRGKIDLGITGQDMVAESNVIIEELLKLGFGKCRLAIQVPIAGEYQDVKSLIGKRIATSFETVVTKYFSQLENGIEHEEAIKALINDNTKEGEEEVEEDINTKTLNTTVNYVSGSVEAACALGLADAVVDLVESGETMREAKLHDIITLINSEAILIANKNSIKKSDSDSKRVLATDYDAIDAHLESLRPLMEQGGYIPSVDHLVPPDVSFDNFLYYMRRKRA